MADDASIQPDEAETGNPSQHVTERSEQREIFRCSECDDFELTKKFSGVAGTPGHEEYNRIEAPDQCPVCGGEIEHEVNP